MHKVRTLGGGRIGPAKSVLDRLEGGKVSPVSVRTPYFFSKVPYRIEVKYELFKQRNLSIPISPVQLDNATSILRALLGVLI